MAEAAGKGKVGAGKVVKAPYSTMARKWWEAPIGDGFEGGGEGGKGNGGGEIPGAMRTAMRAEWEAAQGRVDARLREAAGGEKARVVRAATKEEIQGEVEMGRWKAALTEWLSGVRDWGGEENRAEVKRYAGRVRTGGILVAPKVVTPELGLG